MGSKLKVKYVYYCAILFLIVVSAVTYLVQQQYDNKSTVIESDTTVTEDTTIEAKAEEGTLSDSENQLIYVHVCGHVEVPGVYELTDNSRLYEAIEAAGGLTEDAVESSLNLARVVVDGEQVYVQSMVDIEKGYSGAQTGIEVGGLININTGSLEQLMTLPGIGESKAQSIIDYRSSKGPFKQLEDIMNVTGIKENMYEKIKEHISL